MSHMPALVGASGTIERLTSSSAATPAARSTLVSGVGSAITLANGTSTIDGWIHTFVATSGSGSLTPAGFGNGGSITWAGIASFQLIWDDAHTKWWIVSGLYGASLVG